MIIISNIFTTENIAKYNTKGRNIGVGEYLYRNGTWAINVRPEPFYKNYGDESYYLRNEFSPNTQYLFDFWIDCDDVVYNGNNVAGGFYIRYADNSTNNSFVVTGGNKGFQHITYITDASKSVKQLEAYYYTSLNVYCRCDSMIIPLVSNSSIHQIGVIDTGYYREIIGSTSARIGTSYIDTAEFVEI